MGDRVAVMSKGRLQQVDAPQRLYDRPENLFVAGFIGTPPMNLLEGTASVNGGVTIDLGGNKLPIADEALAPVSAAARVRRPPGDRRPARRRPASRAGPREPADDHRARRAGRVARRRVDGVLQGRRAPDPQRGDRRRRVARRGRRRRGERRRLAPEPRRVVPAARPAAARRRRRRSPSTRRRCTSSTKPRVRRFASCAIAACAAIALAGVGGRLRASALPLAALSSAADAELARLAAHLLRDARPVRERVDGERPGRPHRAARRRPASTRPTRPTTTAATWPGLAANLQRIKDLGFTALWVTPVLKQDPVENGSAAYHGYWGLDFTTVDPHLGTDQDFAEPRREGARPRAEGLPRRRRQPHGRHRPADRHVVHRRAVPRPATARRSTRRNTSPASSRA